MESESEKFARSNLHSSSMGVDQSVSLVERCRDLMAKQTVFATTTIEILTGS